MTSPAADVGEVDVHNERVVIATMIHDASVRNDLARRLDPDLFFDGRNKTIFRGLAEMARNRLEWNEDTLAQLAGGNDFGGFEYLRRIVEQYSSNPNIAEHVRMLEVGSCKLRIELEHIPRIVEACADPEASPHAIEHQLERALVRVRAVSQNFVRRGKALREHYFQRLRTRRALGGIVELTTMPLIDSKLARGLVPGLSCVAGRPGHGKSTFVANMLLGRRRAGLYTFVGAWEMDDEDYLDMMLANHLDIPAVDFTRRIDELGKEEGKRIADAVEWLTADDLLAFEENPFTKLPRPEKHWEINTRNLLHLESTIVRESDRYSLFVFDVFAKAMHDRAPAAFGEALVQVRETSKRYGVHSMLVHHISREGANVRPTLEHLKYSGSFEEECDLIFVADRPILRALPSKRGKMRDVVDVHLLKQRKGPAQICFRYDFDGSRFKIWNERIVDIADLEQIQECA